ncbi:MAG: tRNA lysidine(34) synthetase TilS [Eubacteriales bacterium]|nr:tRNA lysidine(34) synthetase TilS [Eubacteriales bacterium]
MQFEQRVKQYMKQKGMPESGVRLCVGLSGGADSVALLLVLQRLGYVLTAVHVNHNLRGEESDGDEVFVRELCRERQIPLQVYSWPVSAMAEEMGLGLEEAGRVLRQRAFLDAVRKSGAVGTALAHHANDQAETVLFRAARGSSAAGLAGIRPIAEVQNVEESGRVLLLMHPLLAIKRTEIEEWLRSMQVSWRTDRTNLESMYTRNGIRNRVIPYLEEQVNRQTVRHLTEAAEDLAEIDDFLRIEAAEREKRHVRQAAEGILLLPSLREEPPVMQKYILMHALEKLSCTRRNLGREQLRQLQELAEASTGSRISLPYEMAAEKTYEGVLLQKMRREQEAAAERSNGRKRNAEAQEMRLDPAVVPEDLQIHETRELKFGNWHFFLTVLPREDGAIPQNRYTKWFDYDTIKYNLAIRTRLPGDRIRTVKQQEPGRETQLENRLQGPGKKLKEYLIDEKIPAKERDRLPLLASGSEVWWVVGYRIGESGKVTDRTRKILEIQAVFEQTETNTYTGGLKE